MNKGKKNSIVGIIITIAILIFLVAVSNIKIDHISKIGSPFTTFANNIQNGLVYLKNKISGNEQFFINVDEMKAENEKLKKENSELQQTLREFEIVKAENSTLKEYVNLTDKYSEYTTYPAYVIQTDISNYSKTIIINAGKKDGIDVNILGREQPQKCLSRWRKIHDKYGPNGLLQENRGIGSSGRPSKKVLTTEEKLAKLERENEILKEQVHFLKKLRGWE